MKNTNVKFYIRNYSGMLVFFTCGTAAPGCGLPVDTAGGGCATKFCR